MVKVCCWIHIVLYLLKGDDKILKPFCREQTVFLSVITKVELLSHPDLDEAGELVIGDLLSQVKLMEFTTTIQERTVLLRRRYHMKLPDARYRSDRCFLESSPDHRR